MFPVNYLLVTSLRRFAQYYGPEFPIEYPRGSGTFFSIDEVADAVAERLARLFRRDAAGRRPVFGEQEKFQADPHLRDYSCSTNTGDRCGLGLGIARWVRHHHD